MRISAWCDDPDFIGEDNFGRYQCFLDGQPVDRVIECDTAAGVLTKYVVNDKGGIVSNELGTDALTEKLSGVVTILDTRPT